MLPNDESENDRLDMFARALFSSIAPEVLSDADKENSANN